MQAAIPLLTGSDDLRTELFARVRETESPPDLEATPDQKWLLASALQKAIRRGHAELAVEFALKLHSIDPQYCWRRLQIIALEDVGFGDVLSAAITLEAGHSHRFRQRLGERRVLSMIATSLADATKSRLITDLLIVDGDQSQHTSPALIAAPRRSHEAFPWLVQYLSRRNHAGLAKFVLPAWKLIEPAELTVKIDSDPLGDSMLNGYLSASYDMFVAEGKRAARYLAKCPPFAGYTPDQLSMAIWFAQSAVLDRSLTCDETEAVEKEARTKDLLSVGLYDESLVQLMRSQLGLVNYARRRVLG